MAHHASRPPGPARDLDPARPYRAELPPDAAGAELRSEVEAGRLEGEAVQAVLAAAGDRAPARREWPDGLTAPEVELLSLFARGHSKKEIAKRPS